MIPTLVPAGTELRLLLVGASPDHVPGLLRALEEAGYPAQCRQVAHEAEFRDALGAGSWDLVLAGHGASAFGAREVLGLLRAAGQEVPVVVLGATEDAAEAVALLRAGARDWIPPGRLAWLPTLVLREVDVESRRRAHQADAERLRASELRLLRALRATSDGVWEWDPATRDLQFSARCEELLAYGPGELDRRFDVFLDHLHPEDRPGVEAAIRDHLERRVPYDLEFRLRAKDGSQRWFRSRGQAEWDAAGRPVRMTGTLMDITFQKVVERELEHRVKDAEHARAALLSVLEDQHEAERALRESEHRLRLALEGAAQGIWDLDVRSGALRVSPEYATMLGFDPATFATSLDAWAGSLHPDDVGPATSAYRAYVEGRTPSYRVEFRHRAAGGAWRWILSLGRIVERDASGAPLRMLGTHTDITEVKRAQAELGATALRAQVLLELPRAAERVGEEDFLRHVCELAAHLTRSRSARLLLLPGGGGPDRDVRTRRIEGQGYATAPMEASAGPLEDPYAEALRMRQPALRGPGPAGPGDARGPGPGGSCAAAVPVSEDSVVRLLLGAEEREEPHAAVDVETLQLLAEEAWRILRRRRAEDALRRSEERYRDMFEANPHPMWLFDVETLRFLAVNDAAVRCYGYSREEFLAMSIEDIRPHDEVRRLREHLRAGSEAAGQASGVWRHRRKDGSVIDVEITSHQLTHGGRNAKVVLAHDVSERRRAEKTIREYVDRLERAVLGTAAAVSQMVELRDPYTAGHQRRVGDLAAAIARDLGLDEHRQEGLRVAGVVHDVGKIMVPAEILAKPGRLTSVEFELIKAHAAQGYEVLKDVAFPWPVAEVARQHHERLDGSGYPRGLRGDAILLEARIMAVADVVESMASHRPYRPALGVVAALSEVEGNAGRLYDSQVAAACVRVFRDQGYALT